MNRAAAEAAYNAAALRKWAGFVQGMVGRTACRNQSTLATLDTTRKHNGNDWEICLDGWAPRPGGCLAFSVGVGNAWEFDDALGSLGCEVHSFDPTVQLRAAHMLHSAPGVQFHYVGLGKMHANTYGRAGQAGERAEMVALDTMLERWAGTTRMVDVLKIDCEGCEWEALSHVATHAPTLLRRVRLLLLEIHVGMGKPQSSLVHDVIQHLFVEHGFRVYRQRTNLGKLQDRFRAPTELVGAGLHPEPCCYELHLMRPVEDKSGATAAAGAPPSSNIAWKQQHVRETVEQLRAEDWAQLLAYDRRHRTDRTRELLRLRQVHDPTAPAYAYPPSAPDAPIDTYQPSQQPVSNSSGAPCCPRVTLEGTRQTSKALCLRKARAGGCPDATCPVACGVCVLCQGHPQIDEYRRRYYSATYQVIYHAKYNGFDPVQVDRQADMH